MKPATVTTIILLIVVAAGHAVRLLFAVPVSIAGMPIPIWASTLGMIVPLALAIGLWREGAARPRPTV